MCNNIATIVRLLMINNKIVESINYSYELDIYNLDPRDPYDESLYEQTCIRKFY